MRFRLSSLFALVAFASIYVACFTLPSQTASIGLGLLNATALGTLVAGSAYAKKYTQAFCLGALLPFAVAYISGSWRAINGFHTYAMGGPTDFWNTFWIMTEIANYWRAMTIFAIASGTLGGVASVSMRWMTDDTRFATPSPKRKDIG